MLSSKPVVVYFQLLPVEGALPTLDCSQCKAFRRRKKKAFYRKKKVGGLKAVFQNCKQSRWLSRFLFSAGSTVNEL